MAVRRIGRREFIQKMGVVGLSVGAASCLRREARSESPAWRPPAYGSQRRSAARGELADRIARSRSRLRRPPFTQEFILSDVSFKEKRIFTEYSGDISGRIIGVSALEAASGLSQSWPLPALLAELKTYQKPDGHFGADQELTKSITEERDMPLMWGNGRMLVGLVEAHEATGSADALAMARKLGDYYLDTDKDYDKPELVERFGNYAAGFQTCYFSGIEGLVGLSRIVKDGRYRTQARKMADLMMKTTPLGEMHSHGRLCSLRGFLDLYEDVRDRRYLDFAAKDAREIRVKYLFPTGGVDEMMVQSHARDEGCSEADWLRLNLQLWRLTGDDAFLDAAELCLLNEMAVNQFPNGGFGHHTAAYVQGLMDGYYSINDDAAEAYWCCSMHGPRALLEASRSAAAIRGSELFLNLYEPSDVALTMGGSPIRLMIAPGESGEEIAATLRLDSPMRIALSLRVPAWAEEFAVSESGRTLASRTRSGGRVVLDREWERETVLKIRMPFRLAIRREGGFVPSPGESITEPVKGGALFFGPYLMGRFQPQGKSASDDEAFPAALLREARADLKAMTATFPVKAGEADAIYRPIREFGKDGSGFRVRVNAT